MASSAQGSLRVSAVGTAQPSPLSMYLGHDQLTALACTIKCVAEETS